MIIIHGALELILATLWYDVTAIDISEKYIEASKINTSPVNEYIDYKCISVERIAELNKKFDIILCLSVLEHVIDFEDSFKAVCDSLNEEGLILSIVPIGKSWFIEEHTRVFTKDNIYSYFPETSLISEIICPNENKFNIGWYSIITYKQ